MRHDLGKEKMRDVLPKLASENGGKSLVTVPAQPNASSARHKKGWVAGAVAIGALALAAAWWGFGGGGGAMSVSVEALVNGPVKRVLAVSGRTSTDMSADVMSSVSSEVLMVKTSEGETVAAGDLLFVLDDTTQQSVVRQGQAALDVGKIALQGAQEDRDRAVALGDNVSIVAVADAEQALASAKSEVARLEAALEMARIVLAKYQINAPISGVVLSQSAEPGDLVGPTDVLMRLANMDDLHVEVQVDENYADDIHVGQSAQMQLAGRTDVVTGVVSFVAAEVDESTGSLRVKLSFDTPPKAQIGLTTVANILIDAAADVLTVPRSAFVAAGDGTAVFILRDGKATLTPIDYVDWPASRVEVTSGLVEGDRLVLTPEGVVDGQSLTSQSAQE